MNIQELRAKYPEYNDLDDEKLVTGFHSKFYSDIPLDQFKSKLGLKQDEFSMGSAASAVGRTALGMAGAIPQGLRAIGEVATGGLEGAWDRSASSNPAEWLPEGSTKTKQYQEKIGHGLEKVQEFLGEGVNIGGEFTGLYPGISSSTAKRLEEAEKDPQKRFELEQQHNALRTIGEGLGNFVPLPLIKGKGKTKAKETPKDVGDRRKAIDEDFSQPSTDYTKAYEEWNSIDKQLKDAKNPYRPKERQTDWLDENNMPVRQTIGEAKDYITDPTLPKVDESLIVRGAEREQPLPQVVDPEVLASQRALKGTPEPLRDPLMEMPPNELYKPTEPLLGPEPRTPNLSTELGAQPRPNVPDTSALATNHTHPTNEFMLRPEYINADPTVQTLLRQEAQRSTEAQKGGVVGKEAAKELRAIREELERHGWTGYGSGEKPGLFGFGKEPALPIEKTGTRDTRTFPEAGKPFDPSRNSKGRFVPKGQRGMFKPGEILNLYDTLKTTVVKTIDGLPKLMYHGTSKDKDFGNITPNTRGAWFTDNPKEASTYAKENDSQNYKWENGRPVEVNTASRVMPVYLDMKNPYKFTPEDILKYKTSTNYAKAQREIIAKAKSMGHDGLVTPDGAVVVFNKNQIISALSPGQTKAGNSQRGSVPNVGESPLLKGLFKAFGKKENVEPTKFEGQVSTKEATKALPGTGKVFSGFEYVPETIPELMRDYADAKDISQFEANRVATTQSGLGVAAWAYKSPFLQASLQWFKNADRNTKAFIAENVQPLINRKSEYNFNKFSKEDLADYVYALQKAEGKGPLPEKTLARFPETVQAFHKNLVDTQAKAFEQINAARVAAGEKPIEPRPGFMASMFEGQFRALVTDKSGKVVEVISGRSLKELDSKINTRKSKLAPELSVEKLDYKNFPGVKLTDAQSKYAYTRLLEILGEDARVDTVQSVIKDWETRNSQNIYGENQHFKHKNAEALPGAKGLDPTKDALTNAHDYLEAQVQYIEQSIKWAEQRQAFVKTGELVRELEAKGEYPNTIQALNNYRYNAVGMRENMLGEIDSVIHQHMSKVFKDGELPVINSNNSRAYLNAVLTGGANIPFWTLQLVQSMYAIPKFISMRKSFDLKPSEISMSLSKGILDLAYPTSPLAKEARQWGLDNGVITSTIHSDVREMRNPMLSAGMDIWNKGTTISDAISRGHVYMGIVDLLKDKVPRKDLFKLAANNTDAILTDYSKMETPMWSSSGGTLGDNLGFFRKFIGNTLNTGAGYASRGDYAALGALGAIMLFQGGLLGGVGVGTYESIAALWNSTGMVEYGKLPSLRHALLTSNYGKQYPLVRDIVGWGGMSQMPRLVGAKAYDLQSRSSFADVIPHSVADLGLTGASSVLDSALAAGKFAADPSDKTALALAYNLTPNAHKGQFEQLAYTGKKLPDGRTATFNPNDRNKASYPRDTTDQAYRLTGGRSLEESQYKLTQYDKSVENKQVQVQSKKAVDSYVDVLVHGGNAFERNKALTNLEKMAKKVDYTLLVKGVLEGVQTATIPPDKKELLTQDVYKLQRYMEYR